MKRSISTRTADARLQSVDALRGVAALGVVLYHIVGRTPQGDMKNPFARAIESALLGFSSYGYVGVFLFFVISGFCIHLQHSRRIAQGDAGAIDFKAFWKRRLRRLYPPYLIALALYLLFAGFSRTPNFDGFYFYDLATHLLMLHNLDGRTVYSINGVFWTLAIEEQLYLAYFLLLYIRKRWSWRAAILVTLAARVLWFAVCKILWSGFHVWIPVPESAAAHWFTWTLGAIGVEAFFGLIVLPKWTRKFSIGAVFLAVAAALAAAQDRLGEGFVHDAMWLLMHPVWGLGFFVIINWAVNAELKWRATLRTPRAVALLASIGVFSYSLYLTHQLALMEAYHVWFLRIPFYHLRLSHQIVELITSVALCILFAWLFFRLCERPFLSRKAKDATDQTLATTRAAMQDAA